MDTDSLIKIVWGVIIVIVFVASNFKRTKPPQSQEMMDDESQDGASRPMDLETIFREELKRHAQMMGRESIEMTESVEPKSVKSERVVTPQPKAVSKVASRQVAKTTLESKAVVAKSKIAREFDLRRAVIETEILTPKFKNE
ncbi:MAG: hypothetical protein SNG27_05050 [Rikenellaceae bacterium]